MRAPGREFVEASRGARTFPGVPEENYWFRRHEAAYRYAARSIGTARLVLDVGCGEGYGAGLLARRFRVHAVEHDATAAAHASRSYPDVRVIRADACSLPYRAGTFDAVVAMQVLEHLVCPGRFLARARELLVPGGRLILSTPNRTTFSPDGHPNAFHVHEYTADELRGLLRERFRDVSVAGVHVGPGLAALERHLGSSLQHRLTDPYRDLQHRLRLALRAVRARHFVIGPAEGSLDLLATAA